MKAPYLDTLNFDTFAQMLSYRYKNNPDTVAVKYFDGDIIISVTYKELIGDVAKLFNYFEGNGISDCNIGIFSENRYEYIPIYLASVFFNVAVPLDKESDVRTVSRCLDKFDVSVLFYTLRTKNKVLEASEGKNIRLINIDDIFSQIKATEYDTLDFLAKTEGISKDKFCVLASTSGTDGEMKGVMLSHYNIMTNVRGTLENNVLKNPTLAFLPMNHTYGFNPCMLATLYNGTTLCLNLDLKKLARDLKVFDPFFFGAVPMVIEGMYNNIWREARRLKKDKLLQRMINISNFLLKLKIDMRHIFFGNLLNKNLRLVVNGGAALNAFYVYKFHELGIEILNGYGLTECSPTIAVSRECENVPQSAGTIMKNIEVKIADDGEILVKGPCVMLGYYKDDEATRRVMTEDGYLRTGDIGYIDDRLIFVTGRKKNLIILGNGKNVSPEFLESKLLEIPYIKECIVYGKKSENGADIIAAKIYPDKDASSIKEDIDKLNVNLAPYMRIDDYEILTEEFEKTSTKKIKRSAYV